MSDDTIIRRNFLKSAAATTVMFLLSDEQLRAAGVIDDKPLQGPPVKIGLIGLGQWGKEIAASLSRLPSAQLIAICDTYEPALKKAQEIAVQAKPQTDYRKLLETPELEAVIIATPSHLHKEIALASLAAAKHVYCEAPLATTIEDARAIALAAQNAAVKQRFQVGLQGRSNALYRHVSQFIKSGVLGSVVQVSAQWNKKQSWRRAAPTPEREAELNWRLSSKSSSGLIGEIGIHQLDLINWYLGALPVAVTGFGATTSWNDGRDVPDTAQCVFDYPQNLRTMLQITLASSFSDSYTLFQGNNSSMLMREKRGWMMKEADSPLLGWEVYARKEEVHHETGIVMIADASKILAEGKEPGKEGSVEPKQEPLYLALENFTRSIRADSPATICGALEGFRSVVIATKANEAVLAGTKINYQQSWFELKS